MRRVTLALSLAALVAGCATQRYETPASHEALPPAVEAPVEETPSMEEIEDLADLATKRYNAAVTAEDDQISDSLLRQADETLADAQELCDRAPECTGIAATVIGTIIDHQREVKLEETIGQQEPQTEVYSPVSPDTRTVHTGESLDSLIDMNGPIKEMLVKHWLVNYREEFIAAYTRFRFVEEFTTARFEEAELPLELGLAIAIQETFFQNLVSSKGARGVWQIMGYTGKEYGLTPDELFNYEKATQAHLEMSKDWLGKLNNDLLAYVGAYNGGHNRVERLTKGGSKSVFKVFEKLPRETREYILKVAAGAELMRDVRANTDRYRITLPDIDTTLTTVQLPEEASLEEIGILLGNAPELTAGWNQVLYLVNPDLASDHDALLEPGTSITIPHVTMDAYETAFDSELFGMLKDIRDIERNYKDSIAYHRVRKGESLSLIANMYTSCGATLEGIKRANPKDLRPPRYIIQPGDTLAIPCR